MLDGAGQEKAGWALWEAHGSHWPNTLGARHWAKKWPRNVNLVRSPRGWVYAAELGPPAVAAGIHRVMPEVNHVTPGSVGGPAWSPEQKRQK